MRRLFLVSFFLFISSSFVFAQDTILFYVKNSQQEFIKNYKIKFNFYQKGDSLTYYSNKKADIYLPSQLYKKADSIKASYSFYEIKLTEENFANNTIYLNQDLAIDEVVLSVKEKEQHQIGPHKTPFFFNNLGFYCDCQILISFKNNQINDFKNIKGMRFAFKNGFPFNISGGKRIEVLLIGFNTYSVIPKKNNLLTERIIYKIPKKFGKWENVDLSDKVKPNLEEYEYIAFGFKVIDWGIRVKMDHKKNHPNLYLLHEDYYNEGMYDIDQDLETLPLMQLIYEQ
ncbi:hypothetical protein [Mesonia maritima]|uniref:GLPGLI family protein n=1 Tax=Mesonia maritima TaxID=1793873 RepID=A0ABU1K1M4_9FLAO|nr:hypothetical protein [Mesonia maritima]MDR6299493.1 hypothetical protein [Mesonia maritima]